MRVDCNLKWGELLFGKQRTRPAKFERRFSYLYDFLISFCLKWEQDHSSCFESMNACTHSTCLRLFRGIQDLLYTHKGTDGRVAIKMAPGLRAVRPCVTLKSHCAMWILVVAWSPRMWNVILRRNGRCSVPQSAMTTKSSRSFVHTFKDQKDKHTKWYLARKWKYCI